MPLQTRSWCPTWLCLASIGRRDDTIPLRQQFGLWVINKPRLLFQLWPSKEVLEVSHFIQQFLANKNTPLLLPVCDKTEPKPQERPPPCSSPHPRIRWHVPYGRPNLPAMCFVGVGWRFCPHFPHFTEQTVDLNNRQSDFIHVRFS